MGRQSDPRKAAAGERRLARFGDSGLTVARFCAREDLLKAAVLALASEAAPC
jgi:hypothetical protein